MHDFTGRTYMVVGGGSGMGEAAVRRLVSEGARVAVVDRDLEAANQTIAQFGDSAIAIAADITSADEVDAALAATVAWSGRLDGAVNTAGMGMGGSYRDQSLEQFKRVYEVNVFGMYNLIRAEAVYLADHDGGAIVNFASTNALQPAENISAYASSKAAVDMMTKIAAMEFARHGVRVLALGPALTETPMVSKFLADQDVKKAFTDNILLGRPARPEEVAAVVSFMLSEDASYLTGQTIYADGGSLTMRYPTASERKLSK
jgi:NAD(P)-dependent dehydrogenase (short-subunit alcohol dehydrogenase family)